MIHNYFKIAYRNLLKYKTFSTINLLGLSFSMSVCLLIITIINDQLNHDNFHENKDRIYRIITSTSGNEGRSNSYLATTVMPIASTIKNDYHGVADAVSISKSLNGDAKANEKMIRVNGIFADQSFLEIFSFELKSGDASTALTEPYTVLLSEKTAQIFFDGIDPIGKIIELENNGVYTITGIIKDTPSKSHIRFDIVGSGSTIPLLEKSDILGEKIVGQWDNPNSSYVYILIEEGINPNMIQDHLNEISDKHAATREKIFFKFHLQKLSDITPSKLMNNVFSPTLPIEAIIALTFLAAIIIFSACFNYTNLSIARALTRAKEVGIRKVTGAKRGQLIIQFLSESVLFSIISLLIALVMHQFLLSAFNQLNLASEVSMRFDEIFSTYLLFLGFSIVTGIIAGIIPAFFLSSFTPIHVLKNLSGRKLFTRLTLRKSLIVIQFTFSLFFIITAIAIHKQSALLINSDYGFTKENIINIKLKDVPADQFLTEVRKRSDVIQASASSHIPATRTSRGGGIRRKLEDEQIRIENFSVDHHYIDNLGLTLVSGRNFPENISDQHEQFLIINEKGAELLQFKNAHEAIGQEIYLGNNDTTLVQIIGVVKDYNFRMKLMDINAMVLRYKPEQYRYANIKIDGYDSDATIADLEKTWKKFDQIHTFEFGFFDQELEDAYGFIKDLRGIIGITAILAIIIATLGLMGMAIYNAESRIKEVGIRKILGAKIFSIFTLLSKGFFLLIIIAITLATPLAIFVNNLWLQEIPTRISIGTGILSTGIFILLGLGLLTIGSQSIRAAIINPVNSLRSE